MHRAFGQLDLTSAESVIAALDAGAEANRGNPLRRGSIEVVPPPTVDRPWRLIATGDLHDNPFHFARIVEAAGLAGADGGRQAQPAHLTLHEIIHGENLVHGMDLSFRALTKVAALKSAHPTLVHTLLANHELAQVVGSGITKDGVPVVKAFNDGVEYVFGSAAAAVSGAIGRFIRSMPLALRLEPPTDRAELGAILCAHSLPAPELMDRFDASVLEREIDELIDFVPRRGAAHLMVWGRGHTPEQLKILADRWGIGLFVLGHEKAPAGWQSVPPNAVILNSDHAEGVYAEWSSPDWPVWGDFEGDFHRLREGADS